MAVTVHKDVVCPICGTLCDDLEVTVEDNKITKAKNVCIIGLNKLLYGQTHIPKMRIKDKEVTLEEATDEAARILLEAKAPLIYGLSSATCEANREAIELTDVLKATIDNPSSHCHGPGVIARQQAGMPTCTLGEVKNRADLVILWGANPMASHPRHFSKFSVLPKGMYIPEGRKDRTLVVVDVRPTESSRKADHLFEITPGSDFEVVSVLRALTKGARLEGLTDDSLVGGVPLSRWKQFVDMAKNCQYGVVLMGLGMTESRGKDLNVENILHLVCEMNQHTRFNVIPMRGHGNVNGANQTLVWQTGYPLGVNLNRGYPRFNPGEFSVHDLLVRREVDAAMVVATDPGAHLPIDAVEALKEMPTIVLDSAENRTTVLADVVIPVAPGGVGVAGTYYRMDNVPLRLKKLIDCPCPTDETVIRMITEKVRAGLRGGLSHAKN